jgi:hypothetical protein
MDVERRLGGKASKGHDRVIMVAECLIRQNLDQFAYNPVSIK